MKGSKQTILILFGGVSSEHEVSRNSAASILRNIDTERYEVITIGITKDGRWYKTPQNADNMADGSWENDPANVVAYVCPDRSVHGVVTAKGETIRVDCVFPVLHGKNGEDGTMQGLLEIAGLPYVGPGVLASADCMDKGVAKILCNAAGINQAKYYVTDRYAFSHGPTEVIKAIEEACGDYPLFVKPANAGSSVGISKVKNREELFEGIKLAAEHDSKIVVEETIVGRELEVAVLGNRNPKASRVGEIQAADEFYTYDAKYNNVASIAEVAEGLPEVVEDRIREVAVEVYKVLGCKGLTRVDFFLRGENEVVFNEANTIPGFTKISMYPKLWGETGIGYTELITRLIELGMEVE